MARFQPPPPPRPDWVRTPPTSFGWIDARMVHEDWLARLGPHATSVLTLLALAADRHGASFYGRDRMAQRLGISRADVDEGLRTLLDLDLIDRRPWRRDSPDGVWQLLAVPSERESTSPDATPRGPTTIAAVLSQLGITPPIRAKQPG